MTKTLKNITLKTFKELKNRPSPSRRGVTYVIENVDLPGTKNDGKIYKKYVNGKLVQQIFVKKSQHKKLLKKALVKAKQTLKNKKSENSKGGKGGNDNEDKKVVVVMQQEQPTTVGAAKTGFGFGAGIVAGEVAMNGVLDFIGGMFDN
jgi:hypothetical protein